MIKKGAKALSKVVGPLLKKLGPIAARIVGGAIGGPAGAAIGGTIASAILREGEADTEAEFERSDYEFVESGGDSESYESMQEYARDMAEADSEQRTNRSFVAMAQQAARMFRRNRRLKPVIPLVLRGALALVKTFRANRNTRWAIPVIPLIIRRTLTRLARVRKITRKAVVVSMARETAWVLANRRRATLAMRPGSRPKRMGRGRQRPRSRRPVRVREALDY